MFGLNKIRKKIDAFGLMLERATAIGNNICDDIEDDWNGDDRRVAEADAAKPTANGTPARRPAAARRR